MVTTEAYGALRAMNVSPEVSDVRLQALRGAAHHSRAHFLSAAGDDDALRMWLSALSAEQQDRLQHVVARYR